MDSLPQTIKLSATKAHQIYRTSDGKIVPGGSTISKIGEDQGFLINWAWKQGCAGEDYKKLTDKAGDIGSVAHFLITCYFGNLTPDLSAFSQDVIDKGKFVFDKFINEWNERGLVFESNEIQMVSDQYKYGGTLDIIARDQNNKVILIDIKSSPRIYGNFYRQVAAYANLWDESNLEKIDKCFIFRHGKEDPDDTQVSRVYKIPLHFEIFLRQLDLYYAFKKLT